MKWMLLLVPIAIAFHYLVPDQPLLMFGLAAFAIVPLAANMARATSSLASRLGPSIGGLLNATFGNAAEFIIALAALRGGLYDLVKASIAGTIIGNILLVLGVSMVLGGAKHGEQGFDARAARTQATMLMLAVLTLILPAAYRSVVPSPDDELQSISLVLSVLMLLIYVANVVFTMRNSQGSAADTSHGDSHGPPMSNGMALGLLGATTLGIIWLSEILVGVVEPASHSLGLTDAFTGVFVLAVVGGAAEQATAIVAARQNRMDLSLSIALGSSVQLALVVAPALVLLSYFVGPPHPMSLEFGPGLVLTALIAVMVAGQVVSDGRSDWLRGVQLLGMYVILATLFWFVPNSAV